MPDGFRWRLAEDDGGQGALFDEPQERWQRGVGEFRGLEFLHVRAKKIINEVPPASRMPFRHTINAYRGCSHACVYCVSPETPVLLANGRTKPIGDLAVGELVYGTVREGACRRYVPTPVLDHWWAVKRAHRLRLADGTELIASGDHRFLTRRGWRYVVGAGSGAMQRPHLTSRSKLMGVGRLGDPPKDDADYRRGYLCGMIRGEGHRGTHRYVRPMADVEALDRTADYLASLGAGRANVEWPTERSDGWCNGFLAGIFDAGGSFSGDILRIANTDPEIIATAQRCLERLGFRAAVDVVPSGPLRYVRLLGGLREKLRFFVTTDPVITRKRTIDGMALKGDANLEVVAIEDLGIDIPMVDITTGTGDFIADGVVSHNCFARPTHDYLGLNIGDDFDRKIVVKVNAVEKLRAELRSPKWKGESIAMGTNTDPYQRSEGKYRLTRGIVGVLADAANPFSILTKSTLILRDLDLLTRAAERTRVHTSFSIGTLDEEVWKLTEPGTPHPRQRIEAVRKLNAAGIACGVLVAPILPGLSDRPEQLEAVVEACAGAGATSIAPIALHLRPAVREHYLGWLADHRPDLEPLYRERFANRSYQPKAAQHEISRIVAEVLDRTPRARPTRRPRFRTSHEPNATADTRQAGPEQDPLF
jgi:DNA repair photolyase